MPDIYSLRRQADARKRESVYCEHGCGPECAYCFQLWLTEERRTRRLLHRLRTVPADRLWESPP